MKNKQTIKVLQTIRQGKIGGGETHVLDLVKQLDKTRFEPIVLSFTDGPMLKKLKEMGIKTKVIYTEKPFDMRLWKKVYEWAKSQNIDLIHAHGTRANSNSFWAAKQLNVPMIYTVHGWSFHPEQSTIKRLMREYGERFLTKKSDITIVVSKSNKKDGQKYAKLKDAKTKLVNYGIDISKFNPNKISSKNVRREYRISDDKILVGYLVRMTIQKDPFTMLRAAAKVLKQTDKIAFLFIGSGDLKNEVLALASELGVRDKIIFDDFRQDIPDVLRAIDIYCLPSLWEGLPIGLLEAMSMKKAVVATPVDGTKEAIVSGENGILVPCKDDEKLATAILELAKDREKIKIFGEKAYQTVLERFTLPVMAKEVETIYETVLVG
ncbi:MAG: glycosyltransferase family 4 protein [Chitinophagales bacterium]